MTVQKTIFLKGFHDLFPVCKFYTENLSIGYVSQSYRRICREDGNKRVLVILETDRSCHGVLW